MPQLFVIIRKLPTNELLNGVSPIRTIAIRAPPQPPTVSPQKTHLGPENCAKFAFAAQSLDRNSARAYLIYKTAKTAPTKWAKIRGGAWTKGESTGLKKGSLLCGSEKCVKEISYLLKMPIYMQQTWAHVFLYGYISLHTYVSARVRCIKSVALRENQGDWSGCEIN